MLLQWLRSSMLNKQQAHNERTGLGVKARGRFTAVVCLAVANEIAVTLPTRQTDV